MSAKCKSTVRFFLGACCVIAAAIGAFHHLPGFYFAVLFAGGCGMMGQQTIWEKVATLIGVRNTPTGFRRRRGESGGK